MGEGSEFVPSPAADHLPCADCDNVSQLQLNRRTSSEELVNRQKIFNENDLLGTCTETCGDAGTYYNVKGCDKISDCKWNSDGWVEGFVSCDWCECTCEQQTGGVIEEETGKLSTNEDALYGTCCGTCGKNGLVKTDFDGWDEVSNCVFASNGPNDFFCRCDNCNCDGVRRRERSSYTLKNINYDFSAVTNSSIDGDPKDADVVMANSDVENCGDIEQESTTVISFTRSTTTSVETSSTLTTGLTLKVSATQNIGVPADGFTASFSEGFTTSLTKGFTTTKGDSETATFGGEQQVKVKVPGGMRQDFHVVGHQGNINLPYTATLVTHYTKGADKETQTSGSVTIRGVASWATKYDSLTRARCSHEAPENDDVK